MREWVYVCECMGVSVCVRERGAVVLWWSGAVWFRCAVCERLRIYYIYTRILYLHICTYVDTISRAVWLRYVVCVCEREWVCVLECLRERETGAVVPGCSGGVWKYVGLFWVYVGLFWVYVGLFWVYVWLFCVYVGLFRVFVGLFWVYVGLFAVYVGIFWM